MLDRSAIAARIPHQGDMCLLDRVVAWNESSIQCTASSHRRSDNPLREGGRLGVAAGIEYAAQAMAVHGGLLTANGQPPRQGYLASVRGVRFHTLRLDNQGADLQIEAERVSGDARQVLYRFTVSAAGQALLDGRAAVILDAEGLQ
ncbi:3-hydroxylacyl-ACP dehydratase [Zoogloea dura]|jgi:predicted hotdog family 3-hydroxylacyl-ACP dehydratase|uniref:3-hydroxylacyl-ACP dehydratase n=1 Tax=Zoogloea dura TaxID=2728840 RepID=A0A848G0V8_9RHOO|nr:3-hydroxylacyl-ACP dehydratase [Zoogloea dura]NML25828.1 3-hydroxylacyl-ACP dehydratase [Zoogloea dura]